MTPTAQEPGHGEPIPPPARVVVQFESTTGADRACRVEAPARVVRMWSVLYATDKELHQASLPPQALARIERLLATVRAELERSLSPALARELRHLIGRGRAHQGPDELRVECTGLLGWTSDLVVAMLDQLAAAGSGRRGYKPEFRT